MSLILVSLASLASLANAQACPAVGNDTDCGILITVTDKGAKVTITGQGPFDGIEDTLVGVVNNSKLPVVRLGLKGKRPIFDFDGDGLVAFGIPGNAQDSTGYGGPNAFSRTLMAAGLPAPLISSCRSLPMAGRGSAICCAGPSGFAEECS